MYRCVATSAGGFVQQLATSYLANGYWFYVSGRIPAGKDPARVDAKLIERYDIDLSQFARARRKRAGSANLQYLRYEHFFLLLATHGRHRFFDEEKTSIRDARRVPVKFARYSIGVQGSAVRVAIERGEYRQLKAARPVRGRLAGVNLVRDNPGVRSHSTPARSGATGKNLDAAPIEAVMDQSG